MPTTSTSSFSKTINTEESGFYWWAERTPKFMINQNLKNSSYPFPSNYDPTHLCILCTYFIYVCIYVNESTSRRPTQPVDSIILSSRGSPRGCPPSRATEWQQARAESMGPGARSLGSGTSSEKPAPPPSITPHTSSPSSVSVPVWGYKQHMGEMCHIHWYGLGTVPLLKPHYKGTWKTSNMESFHSNVKIKRG